MPSGQTKFQLDWLLIKEEFPQSAFATLSAIACLQIYRKNRQEAFLNPELYHVSRMSWVHLTFWVFVSLAVHCPWGLGQLCLSWPIWHYWPTETTHPPRHPHLYLPAPAAMVIMSPKYSRTPPEAYNGEHNAGPRSSRSHPLIVVPWFRVDSYVKWIINDVRQPMETQLNINSVMKDSREKRLCTKLWLGTKPRSCGEELVWAGRRSRALHVWQEWSHS